MAGEPAFFEIGVEDPELGDEDPAEYGRFMLCKDDQGSTFGLHQPPAP